MDGIDLSGDIPAFTPGQTASLDNTSPFEIGSNSISIPPYTLASPSASAGDGNSSFMSDFFSRKTLDTAIKAGLDYTTLKNGGTSKPATGPSPQYVGAVNPPPGDWLSNIFTKLAQPNNFGASPANPTGAKPAIISTTMLYVLGGIAVLFLFFVARR